MSQIPTISCLHSTLYMWLMLHNAIQHLLQHTPPERCSISMEQAWAQSTLLVSSSSLYTTIALAAGVHRCQLSPIVFTEMERKEQWRKPWLCQGRWDSLTAHADNCPSWEATELTECYRAKFSCFCEHIAWYSMWHSKQKAVVNHAKYVPVVSSNHKASRIICSHFVSMLTCSHDYQPPYM